MRRFVLTFFSLFLLLVMASAQDSKPTIFIDCQMRCYRNYVKEQITFVNYMQDRVQADIFILATNQRTGAGGRKVQLVFQGNNDFTGMKDTLTYVIDPNSTESIQRDQLVQGLKRGLLKYIVQTDMLNDVEYSIAGTSVPSESAETEQDPWNYWVFNVGGNGWIEGEQSYKNSSISGRFSANRITDKHKFEFSSRYNYQENIFTLTDGEKITSIFKSYNFYLEYVKSLSPHWSLGGMSQSGSSTFGNTDVSTTIRAAVEYNIFPYSEAQTRRFSFFYSAGPEYYDYTEPTIYEKEKEWVGRHSLTIEYEQTQKWGEVSISLGAQQFFHDFSLYNAYLSPRIEWQIYKGLTLDFGGFLSFVTDRINIAKSDISDEEIILQIKQLDTDFTYFSRFGINYRFGSKYNNFVNPRF
ncbi:MAG: hypothetical protein HKN51_07975 [Saprospiraceae bacterium]|nr:hypothetical protein [Saprospiraceae bacterium]